MSVPLVDLERRFVATSEGQEAGVDLDWLRFLESDTGWPQLLDFHRVVILAEAGSGKTTEMKAKAEQLRGNGRSAFYMTVRDLGDDGLPGALDPGIEPQFQAWLNSDLPGWIFVDSVDEARLTGMELRPAIRKLARAIHGCERRAHIVLSSRYSDWDFQADKAEFDALLPYTSADPPPPPTEAELVRMVIRHEKLPQAPPPEPARVFAMAPLDEARVRTFTLRAGVENPSAFVEAVSNGGLWRFAQRPLDLGWMVEFWRDHGRLGRLSEMVEASLSARLLETNRRHGRQDDLDTTNGWSAIERVGAALTFARSTTMAAPTVDLSDGGSDAGPTLAEILPDWPSAKVTKLQSRPVFDPTTLGRTRLHNDNDGDVRAFLAARWLSRLRASGCPELVVGDLLFADIYGVAAIRPSLRKTTAWLSLLDHGIAGRAVALEPGLLLSEGDPESLSDAMRENVLASVITSFVADPGQKPIFDHDRLRRFAKPALAPQIREAWSRHGEIPAVRHLLLMLISLGRITACLDLAREAAFSDDPEEVGRIFAARALIDLSEPEDVRRYAEHLLAHAAELPAITIWDAVERLFPRQMPVAELLALLDARGDDDYGLRRLGKQLAEQLDRPEDLKALIRGLLARAEQTVSPPGGLPTSPSRGIEDAIGIAAVRLIACAPSGEVPDEVIEAWLFLKRDPHSPTWRESDAKALRLELQRTSARRRQVFWGCVDRLKARRPHLFGETITNVFQFEHVGWPCSLEISDLDWLITDGIARPEEADRQLALSAAHDLWRKTGADPGHLGKLKSLTAPAADLAATLALWLGPQPESETTRRQLAEMEAMRQRHAAESDVRDESWRAFIAEMKADPGFIRALPPPSPDNVNRALFQLWELATAACGQDGLYAWDDLTAIETVFGAELTEAFAEALIAFWRHWTPTLHLERPHGQRHTTSKIDIMALTGIGLEAQRTSNWSRAVSREDASRAAAFASLELNGFPSWLADLARDQPIAVAEGLGPETARDLDAASVEPHTWVLDRLARGDEALARALAPQILQLLQARPGVTATFAGVALDVVVKGLPIADRPVAVALVLERGQSSDLPTAAVYLAAGFALDPEQSLAALVARLDQLPPESQTDLGLELLPRVFRGADFRHPIVTFDLPFSVLVRLVEVAFGIVRIEDDSEHPGGMVYSPDPRDHAESARSAAFNRLVSLPGRATFDTLLTLASVPAFPVPPRRLHELARARALEDSEFQAWTAGDARAFEQAWEHAPKTGVELQQLAARRIQSIEHELIHGPFNQGATLKLLPNEQAVQNWVAQELRNQQVKSYGVEREPHRAEEKEPDIVLRTKAGDASLAIEIKVAESWSCVDLDNALEAQLCGRYLRAASDRHGMLLLVHQSRRPIGWQEPASGRWLTFEQLVDRLTTQAALISARTNDGPQPVIAVLDVSSLAAPPDRQTAIDLPADGRA